MRNFCFVWWNLQKKSAPRRGFFYCSLTPLSVLRLLLLYYTTSSSAPPTYHHNNVFATEWQEEILVQRNEIRLDELSWGIMDSKMISETALNDCTTTSPTNWNYSITNSRNTIIYNNSSTKYSSFLFVKLICEWVSLLRRLSVYIKKTTRQIMMAICKHRNERLFEVRKSAGGRLMISKNGKKNQTNKPKYYYYTQNKF